MPAAFARAMRAAHPILLTRRSTRCRLISTAPARFCPWRMAGGRPPKCGAGQFETGPYKLDYRRRSFVLSTGAVRRTQPGGDAPNHILAPHQLAATTPVACLIGLTEEESDETQTATPDDPDR